MEELNPVRLKVVTAYVEPSLTNLPPVNIFSLSGMGTLP